MSDNRLLLHLGKTENIVWLRNVIYLGCVLDCHLSGVGQALKVSRISKFLDQKTMLILVGALIQPYYDYACGSWCNGVTMHFKHTLGFRPREIS